MSTTTEERAAYSVAEFAALMGRTPAWGYQRVADGSLPTFQIAGGRHFVAAATVEAIRNGTFGEPEPIEDTEPEAAPTTRGAKGKATVTNGAAS